MVKLDYEQDRQDRSSLSVLDSKKSGLTSNSSFYSNDRKLNLADYLEILIASSFPQTTFEPIEISKLRDEGKCSLQIAHDIPGTIFDSKVYLYLRKIGRING